MFTRGIGVPVSQSERDHLELHAVERFLRPDFDPEGDDLPEDFIETVCALTFVPLERPSDDPIPQSDHEPADPSAVL